MDLIWTLIIGLIIGVLARLILPGREPISSGALGWLITALIGVVGSFLGSFIATKVLGVNESNTLVWLIMSIVGAIILLLLYRLVVSKMAT